MERPEAGEETAPSEGWGEAGVDEGTAEGLGTVLSGEGLASISEVG